MDLSSSFWLGLLAVIFTDIVLSGDNAVVIALAARGLPPEQQRKAMLYGSLGAIVLRVALTFMAAFLMTVPYLKAVGGIALLYVAFKLLQEEEDAETHEDRHNSGFVGAVKLIILADLTMSIDNVLAVAAAAEGHFVLLVIGLLLSMALIMFSSTLLVKVLDKMPWLAAVGAAFIGYLAGKMIAEDQDFLAWFGSGPLGKDSIWFGIGGAASILLVTTWKKLTGKPS